VQLVQIHKWKEHSATVFTYAKGMHYAEVDFNIIMYYVLTSDAHTTRDLSWQTYCQYAVDYWSLVYDPFWEN
jgi:hypothetical protein